MNTRTQITLSAAVVLAIATVITLAAALWAR